MPLKPRAPTPERLDAIEAELGEARSNWRASIRAIAVLWLLTIVVAGWAAARINRTSTHAVRNTELAISAQRLAATARGNLRAAQIAGCHRENVQRVTENRAHLDQYHFDVSIVTLLARALARPRLTIPGLGAKRQQEERTETEHLLHVAHEAANHLEWGHLIGDCQLVIDEGRRYVFPPPIKFAKQLPPKGALRVEPGE